MYSRSLPSAASRPARLLSRSCRAVVEATRKRIPLPGEIPSATAKIEGCPFRSRCPKAFERCAVEAPLLKEHRPGRFAACHLPEEGRA